MKALLWRMGSTALLCAVLSCSTALKYNKKLRPLEKDYLSVVYELVISKTQIPPMTHLTSLSPSSLSCLSALALAVPTAWKTVSHIFAELAHSTSSFRPQIQRHLLKDASPWPPNWLCLLCPPHWEARCHGTGASVSQAKTGLFTCSRSC